MKIALSGSRGLIGSHLYAYYTGQGHHVIRLGRSFTSSAAELEGCDAVIHLAGVSIADKPWTNQTKEDILSSRIDGTRSLTSVLVNLKHPPKVFFCASATGYYGSSLTTSFTEDSLKGEGFLADVCARWEMAASLAKKNTAIRVINLRFSPVLSFKGGILKAMLPVFSLGLGGPLGSGSQRVSWIALNEIPAIIDFLIKHTDISGPVNCTSPNPVSNLEFSQALAAAFNKPCFIRVPRFVIQILFGEMGEALLLGGADVRPSRLMHAGYQFSLPQLADVFYLLRK